MNRLLILPVLLFTLLVGNPASSADWEKGLTAYNRDDYATALREWTPLAKQGDARAQYNLGVMYDNGQGVSQDYKTAVKWYKLAAEQGYAPAQFNLGFMYDEGQGVPQDYKTAVKWYRLAAEQGNYSANNFLKRLEKTIFENKQVISREKQSISNPGFRDLKPGLHRSTIKKKKICESSLNNKSGTTCYNIQNLKFLGTFYQDYLTKLTIDLGPIVGSVGLIDELATYIQKGETNIYLKMRTALGEKYKLDFEYSERDRQLFNKDEKDKLHTVYEKGQVALLVERKKKNYSHELWLYIEYRDVKPAEVFFKSAKPKRAKKSDF